MKKELLIEALENSQFITTETKAVGGGEWSLEVYADGKFLFEFVGPNGTRDGEEPADLWAEFHDLMDEVGGYSFKYRQVDKTRKGARNSAPRR